MLEKEKMLVTSICPFPTKFSTVPKCLYLNQSKTFSFVRVKPFSTQSWFSNDLEEEGCWKHCEKKSKISEILYYKWRHNRIKMYWELPPLMVYYLLILVVQHNLSLMQIPDDKELAFSKLKAFFDDFIILAQKMQFLFHRVENTMCKGLIDWLIKWCFMPLLTVFQSYHGDSSHYSCFPRFHQY